MSAKWMKAVNITSSLSKREKILLKPLSRRNNRSIFVETAIHDSVVLPRVNTALLGWHDRRKPQLQHQLPCFAPLVRPVHDHGHCGMYRLQHA